MTTSFPRATMLARSALVLAALHGGAAHAVSTSTTVPVSLGVVSPTCSVANDNATIVLPTVTSVSQTHAQWMSLNAITTSSVFGGMFTSSAFNQTATISCNLANVAILSFVVKPSASASLLNAGLQYLVDATPTTPLKAFAANFALGADQVSVNGNAAAAAYYGSNVVTPYTTVFATGALASGTSTATVVWRPTFMPGSAAPVGTPTGGSFTGAMDIVVNY